MTKSCKFVNSLTLLNDSMRSQRPTQRIRLARSSFPLSYPHSTATTADRFRNRSTRPTIHRRRHKASLRLSLVCQVSLDVLTHFPYISLSLAAVAIELRAVLTTRQGNSLSTRNFFSAAKTLASLQPEDAKVLSNVIISFKRHTHVHTWRIMFSGEPS